MIERLTPKDRRAWLALRGRDVTASTVGALFGEHEFLTIYELWAQKTGRLPRGADAETPAMQRGRLLEPVAIALMREMHPEWQIEHNAAENVYYRDPEARIGATPDAIVTAPGRGLGVVQIKSVEASVYRRKWIVEGEPEPPLWIALQASVEAHLTGAKWAAVAPLVVGHGLEMPIIEVPLADGVISAIKERVADFWQMVAEGREPEPDYARDGDVLDAMYPHSDAREEVDLSTDNRINQLIADRVAARAAITAAEADLKAIDAEVKAKMGFAEVAHVGGGRRITWETRRRSGYVAPATTYRFLKFPKPEGE